VAFGDERDAAKQLPRPGTQKSCRMLPELKPSALYIWDSKSDASTPANGRVNVETTGTGVGGSGGVKAERAREVLLDCGHLVGMGRPAECAEATAAFVDRELRGWETREKARDEALKGLSRTERVGINDLWREKVGSVAKPKGRL